MNKPWYKSKKFLALLVGIAGVLLPVLLKDAKWSGPAGDVWKMIVTYLIAQGYIDSKAAKEGE